MHNPETIRRGVFVLFLSLVSVAPTVLLAEQAPLAWPEIEQQHRPWGYWWWMGSAVDAKNITSQLETFQQAGMGGAHIVPIYGAKGYEDRYIDYLSPKWMEMLEHCVREGNRLDMGIDMTTGTGWCFGGPQITDDLANAFVQHETRDLETGKLLEGKFGNHLQAIVAYSEDGQHVDLTHQVGTNGSISWVVPDGKWQLMTIWQKPMRNVKRAAPGGEGRMLNTYFDRAIEIYLEKFTSAFDTYDGPLPRSMYHDSYEYQCDWSPNFLVEFERRRGYRLQEHLPSLLGDGNKTGDQAGRVRGDYNRTLTELMLNDFLQPWVDWCHEHGMITRNEAHGSPGNLLDLYAVADIPEAEMFRQDRDPLVAKFSSSAAHVAGRKLVANETGTWLRDHFHVTLADLKLLIDELFVSGINHVFYHGTIYSPAEAPWPGWVFYASTQMNPHNPIWRDAPVLNQYIARCQSILQSGQPDNDVLLYWPIEDFWYSEPRLAHGLAVHHTEWLTDQPIGISARQLWDRGYAFDYISDLQIQGTSVDDDGKLETSGARYQVLVVPPCQHMPLATLKRLLGLAEQGATIVFEGGLPADVPGLADLESRRAKLQAMLSPLEQLIKNSTASVQSVEIGQGTVWIGDLETSLTGASIPRESIADLGIKFIRRTDGAMQHYFIVNLSDEPIQDWVTLSASAPSVVIMDPMTGAAGRASVRHTKDRQTQVYLQLLPGESRVLRTLNGLPKDVPLWEYLVPTSDEIELTGKWQIEFLAGGPSLPETIITRQLKTWTDLGGEETERFSGTARYTVRFDSPEAITDSWRLDLGDCRHSASVTLNGRRVGAVITEPFELDLPAGALKLTGNLLEIEVTNLAINRIADLDRRGVEWKYFHDINFVNIDYEPFDASQWPVSPSGLLKPVILRRLQTVPSQSQ